VQTRQHVLVLGDWFVDDHWVVGDDRSTTSSRIGRRHLSSLQDVHSATESLCGAGRTAAVLHGAGFDLTGVGVCSPRDEEVLLELLNPRGVAERNPHTLRRWTDFPSGESGARGSATARFVNLGTPDCGTWRAIRFYEVIDDRIELTQRVDWETELPGRLETEKLAAILEDRFDAVVIKDLGKGLLDSVVLGMVAAALRDVPWFVSTKVWRPHWRTLLTGVDLRLLLIPDMAARAALGDRLDHKSDVDRRLASWMVGRVTPSKGALAMVDNRLLRWLSPDEDVQVEPTIVVVVPDDQTVLAFHQDGSACLFVDENTRETVPLPLASVLLGSLTARLLGRQSSGFDESIRGAVGFVHRWREFEIGRITHHSAWKPSEEPKDDLASATDRLLGERSFNWPEAQTQWVESFNTSRRGVVMRNGEHRLELWRSMTELDGYVCIVRTKRSAVARLVDMVRSFDGYQARSQESCLIKASSGAGKTHLVKCLARVGGFRVLEFNLTQLLEPRDIVECFERISTAQADIPDNRLLVFFDEINAPIGGRAYYGSFLTVLEQGVYQVSGKAFHLRPALWLFAGTEFDESNAASKAPDFKSRLTRGVVDLQPQQTDPEGGAEALERVYLGALLLKQCFREIEWINEDVLDVFKRLPATISARKLREFARKFSDVRRRTVDADCVPWRWIEENAGNEVRKQDWEDVWRNREGGVPKVRLLLRDE